jgi:hypothetical protein
VALWPLFISNRNGKGAAVVSVVERSLGPLERDEGLGGVQGRGSVASDVRLGEVLQLGDGRMLRSGGWFLRHGCRAEGLAPMYENRP